MNAPPVRRRLRAAALALVAILAAGMGVTLAAAPASAATVAVEVDDAQTEGSPRFEYSGTWAADSGLPDAWFNGTEHVSGAAQSYVTLSFTGTQAKLYGNTHPNHGVYYIFVDSAYVGTFDAYAPVAAQRQLIYDTGELVEGDHTVTMMLSGQKNEAANGIAGQIDYAVVERVVPVEPVLPAWAAVPQPNEMALTDAAAWTPSASSRIFVPRAQQTDLQREADRLSSELAVVLDRAALPIVVGSDEQIAAGDIVLRLGEAAASASPEAYSLDISDRVVATASTDEGVFRATRQIIQNLTATGSVPAGKVSATPAVKERALHLDLARKFYSAEWIKQELRDMAYVGVNSFQFHFSENEGFRVESDTFPQIVSTEHLTKAEVREIVALAEDLHIDVVPALNMPGHLNWALQSFPELQLRDVNNQPVAGALDITKPEALEFAYKLVDEYVELFPNSTHWNIGADEFVDFGNMAKYPVLREEAERRFGAGATGFDLLTDFANKITARVEAKGFTSRVWNDGMFRSSNVTLDPDTQINWWTNWERGMVPVSTALNAGHDILNYNDSQFYFVLGEAAGYRYPTAKRIWDADWHPGVFPRLPADNTAGVADVNQVLPRPYTDQLLGASFAIWSDRAEALTQDQVSTGVREPLRAQNERSWNAGSALALGEFTAINRAIDRAPGIASALGAPGATTVLDGAVTPPVDPPVTPPVVTPPVVTPPVVTPPVVQPPANPGTPAATGVAARPASKTAGSLPDTGLDAQALWGVALLAGLLTLAGAGMTIGRRVRRES